MKLSVVVPLLLLGGFSGCLVWDEKQRFDVSTPDIETGTTDGTDLDVATDAELDLRGDDGLDMSRDAEPDADLVDDWLFTTQPTRRRINWPATALLAAVDDVPLAVMLDVELAVAESVRFVDDNGALLPFDLERGPDAPVYWVKLPRVEPNTAGHFIAYYGNVDDPAQPDPATVWSSYAAVWHFDEIAASAYIDRVAGLRMEPRNPDAYVVSETQVPARIGWGIEMVEIVPLDASFHAPALVRQAFPEDYTVELHLVMDPANFGVSVPVLGQTSPQTTRGFALQYNAPANAIRVQIWQDSGPNPTSLSSQDVVVDDWKHIATTMEELNGLPSASLFDEGLEVGRSGSGAIEDGWVPSNQLFILGNNNGLVSIVDEVRVRSVPSTPAYLQLQQLSERGELFTFQSPETR